MHQRKKYNHESSGYQWPFGMLLPCFSIIMPGMVKKLSPIILARRKSGSFPL
jgi:hypothetical protein